MASRPRIGIGTSLNDGEQRLDRRYVVAIERAGGIPMPVPMTDDARVLEAFCEMLDGLVLTGGPAITEGLVGKVPEDLKATEAVREASDRILLRYARREALPVLGICYGMQLINALAGGTLYADVQAQLDGCAVHSEKRGAADHTVHLAPGSHLQRITGSDEIVTNSRHIQAVAEVAPGFQASGHTADGVLEAIESEDGRAVGVQFHPERMGDAGLPFFIDLIQKAYERREQEAPSSA